MKINTDTGQMLNSNGVFSGCASTGMNSTGWMDGDRAEQKKFFFLFQVGMAFIKTAVQ